MSAFPHIFSRTKPYAHAPISFTRVLSPDAGDKQHVLLTVWFLSMMPMIFGGLMVLRGSAIPVEIGGVDIRLTFYFPVVLCTLYALWFGYWWGAIPAFIAHATVAVAGGVGVWWALLLGVTDLLALGVLIVADAALGRVGRLLRSHVLRGRTGLVGRCICLGVREGAFSCRNAGYLERMVGRWITSTPAGYGSHSVCLRP